MFCFFRNYRWDSVDVLRFLMGSRELLDGEEKRSECKLSLNVLRFLREILGWQDYLC